MRSMRSFFIMSFKSVFDWRVSINLDLNREQTNVREWKANPLCAVHKVNCALMTAANNKQTKGNEKGRKWARDCILHIADTYDMKENGIFFFIYAHAHYNADIHTFHACDCVCFAYVELHDVDKFRYCIIYTVLFIELKKNENFNHFWNVSLYPLHSSTYFITLFLYRDSFGVKNKWYQVLFF